MRMFGLSLRTTVLVVCATVISLATGALANSVPPGNVTLPFADGGNVSGSFIYDPTTNSILSWNFVTTSSATFQGATFNSADGTIAASSVLATATGDESLTFIEIQNSGLATEYTAELDLVVSCGSPGALTTAGTPAGTCLQNATVGTSFALITGNLAGCTSAVQVPGTATFLPCATSSEQDALGLASPTRLLTAGFINVEDPAVGVAMNLDTTAKYPLVTGGGNNTGGGPSVPEPSCIMLLGTGLVGLAMRRFKTQK